MKCPKCGRENPDNTNFCIGCSAKLHEVCPCCWIKNDKPYNCGLDECLGRKMLDKRYTNEDIAFTERRIKDLVTKLQGAGVLDPEFVFMTKEERIQGFWQFIEYCNEQEAEGKK